MTTKTQSSEDRVVLPEAEGWPPGSSLETADEGGLAVAREDVGLPETTLDELIGCAGYTGPRRSLADFEAAIAEGARRR